MYRYANTLYAFVCLLLVAGCGPTLFNGQAQPNSELTVISSPIPSTTEATPQATLEGPSPAVVPTDTHPSTVPLTDLMVELRPITKELRQPVQVTHAGDGSGRLFVVEKQGRIIVLHNGKAAEIPFLDIADRVGSQGSEQGLLSVAFHPAYAQNGHLFVNYTNVKGDTVISRFQARGDTADPKSEEVLLTIDQPYANHNGGLVLFGPDGYLYIGMGDGGSAGDPQGNGQNPNTLLGKMLRIDVDNGNPYAIPPSNPWANGNGGRPEIWSIGLRNPWRFSFDRATHDLYIADVGQDAYEEIDWQPAGSTGGQNYGWSIAEGQHCFQVRCDLAQYTAPIAEYTHDYGCSVTGGYVYRGTTFPRLQGAYIFGDYCSGRIWALRRQNNTNWEQTQVLASMQQISSFGEDEAGELYLTSMTDNGLYQIVETGGEPRAQ